MSAPSTGSSRAAAGSEHAQDVAVIGMSGRFPGAADLHGYWCNIRDGVESITRLSDEQLASAGVSETQSNDPSYVKAAAILPGVDQFDAAFFGYSPREAALMDPQCRLFLECAWEALESSGYVSSSYAGSIGVYASASLNTYLLRHVYPELDLNAFTLSGSNIPAIVANAGDFLCSRVSYKLNLRGPSINVQSACSSSLVAIHLARQSVLSGECDVALAGGVSIYLPQETGYVHQDGMILSKQGRCRAFDVKADGILFGRGCGVVVLKRLEEALEDGDFIHAVIRGSAVNNDGANKVGFTAPSVAGQAEVVAEALADAGIEPESVTYVEAHGTGTVQGDPIEVAALQRAFSGGEPRTASCALGTVKTNFGHLDVAAGVAGFIKTVLMLEHRQLPPSLHFEQPNPQLELHKGPFYVNRELRDWPSTHGRRRAGVSSFGFGGTNAHVILEEAPERAPSSPSATEGRRVHLLKVSAKSEAALRDLSGRYADHLASLEPMAETSLADVCFTANAGRSDFDYRATLVGSSFAELRVRAGSLCRGERGGGIAGPVKTPSSPPRVVFMFTGQGSQHAGMGRELYEQEPRFRASLERCAAVLDKRLDRPLLDVLYGDAVGQPLNETVYAQPALFALAYALTELWYAWGVRPNAVLGHSVGEYAAACAAGVFCLEDGLELIAERARLMQCLPSGGAMAAVLADPELVAQAISEHRDTLAIAAYNGPANVVVSGAESALSGVLERLESNGVACQRLAVSHAFHSALMEPILDAFEKCAGAVNFRAPSIDIVSNLTGVRAGGDDMMRAAYWRQHVRAPVRFAQAIRGLLRDGHDLFLEIGPHATLTSLAKQSPGAAKAQWLASLQRGRSDWEQMLEAAGAAYAAGVRIDWNGLDAPFSRRRVPMPTYPFQRKRFWLERSRARHGSGARGSLPQRGSADMLSRAHPLLGERLPSPLREIQFHSQLSQERLPFLGDHRIGLAVIMPATAYVELALAAAREVWGTQPCALEDLQLSEALVVPAEEPISVQVVVSCEADGLSFKVFSASSTPDGALRWVEHASGNVAKTDGSTPATRSDSAAIPKTAKTLPGAEFYKRLQECGFGYGETFRGVDRLWVGDAEAWGRIASPSGLKLREPAFASLHPAVVDACLQVLFAALPAGVTESEGMYLPVGIRRCRFEPAATDVLISHVRLTPSAADCELEGDFLITDEHGALIGEVSGVRLKKVAREAFAATFNEQVGDWFYGLAWRPKPLASDAARRIQLPSPAVIGKEVEPVLEVLCKANDMPVYDELEPMLDELCSRYVIEALRRIGCSLSVGAIVSAQRLVRERRIRDRYERLTARLLEMLAEDGVLAIAREAGDWTVVRDPSFADSANLVTEIGTRFPVCSAEVTLLQRCGKALGEVLEGKRNPLDLLFPKGSVADLIALYRDAPFTRTYNALVRDIVLRAVRDVPADAHLRVLEIGAGTAGTASWVIPSIAARQIEYVFTDLSPLFLARAEKLFGSHANVKYRILDIGRDPARQGFENERFDIVVATNVLHATPDLAETLRHVRGLMAPQALLIAVEGIAQQRWVDLTFGLTDGWWLAEDALRGSYPLIGRAQWLDLLASTGFGVGCALPAGERESFFKQAVFIAQNATADDGKAEPLGQARKRWLIFADEAGTGTSVAERLRARGEDCLLVSPASTYRRAPAGGFSIRADIAEDYQRLLSEAADVQPIEGVLFLWPLEPGLPDALTVEDLERKQMSGAQAALLLVGALANREWSRPPRLWLVTRGVQAVADDDLPMLPHSVLTGFARTIRHEHPEFSSVHLDLDPQSSRGDADSILAELGAADESEVAVRNGVRYASRLERAEVSRPPDKAAALPGGFERLQTLTPGLLESLAYVRDARPRLGPNDVEIDVVAAGLNFKDLLNALGAYPGEAGSLGCECAGIVRAVGADVTNLQPGMRVMAIAPGAFAGKVLTRADLVVELPPGLGFDDAAGVPSVFVTARYALFDVARLGRGERVLVHAAAGGVGLAAVQLAQRAGATVLATAGSAAKRRYLTSIGVNEVFDSRTLSFADDLLERTGGAGVDVVLNSLSGDFIEASLKVLSPEGRFIELGKRGIWTDDRVKAAKPLAEYRVIDVDAETRRRPGVVRAALEYIRNGLAAGTVKPLPTRVFSRHRALAAFRCMSEARHIGKLVLSQRLPRSRSEGEPLCVPDGCYLIAGGLGGLGLLVAEWMIGQGARKLLLAGRSPPSESAERAIARLRDAGADVEVLRLDVSRRPELAALLDRLRSESLPLRGVIHAAGVLDDGVLVRQDWQRFRSVFGPKVLGAWNLHDLTRDLPLDFFVLFSSIAALLGPRGQANHAAACAFEDALAQHRRAAGLPALSINWGAWTQAGAAFDRDLLRQIGERGIKTIEPRLGLHCLARALSSSNPADRAQLAVVPIDWPVFVARYSSEALPHLFVELAGAATTFEPDPGQPLSKRKAEVRERLERAPQGERVELLRDYLRDRIAQRLGMDRSQHIGPNQALSELGLDSLLAIELRGMFNAELALGRSLPSTLLFDYPTLQELAEYLATLLPASRPGRFTGSRSPAAADTLVEQLSEDEAERLLLEELENGRG